MRGKVENSGLDIYNLGLRRGTTLGEMQETYDRLQLVLENIVGVSYEHKRKTRNQTYFTVEWVWLKDEDAEGWLFEKADGETFYASRGALVKCEDIYAFTHFRAQRRGNFKVGIICWLHIVNKSINKNGTVRDRRPSETLTNDLEKWKKLQRYNLKAAALNADKMSIKNGKALIKKEGVGYHNNTPAPGSEFIVPKQAEAVRLNAVCYDKLIFSKGIKKIDYMAVSYGAFSSLELNNDLGEIGPKAFLYCTRLKEVDIPASVQKIGAFAFNKNYSLEKVKFNGIMKYIGKGALSECQSLREIELPNGLEVIPDQLLASCPNLNVVFIPKSVKKVSPTAFAYSNSIRLIVAPKHLQDEGRNAYGINGLSTRWY